MKRKEIPLEEIRIIQLDILEKVHNYCIKNNIRYSLGGGTLLGAIRHKGYIPWDDDIDIMMPRPDYEKFIKDFNGLYKHYIVQHYKNDPTYHFPFAKIYDNRTILIEKTIRTGVFIDIFPIDGLPQEEKLADYLKKYEYYLGLIYKTTYKHFNIKLSIDYLKTICMSLCKINKIMSIDSFEMFCSQYDFESSNFCGCIVGLYKEKEHMKSEVFKKYISLPFEGKEFMAIAAFDDYLIKHYGNYMQLPPKESQIRPHSNKVWRV